MCCSSNVVNEAQSQLWIIADVNVLTVVVVVVVVVAMVHML